jgi:hypothetical protein
MPVIIQRRILTDGAVDRVKKKKYHNYKTTASHHGCHLCLIYSTADECLCANIENGNNSSGSLIFFFGVFNEGTGI